MAKKAAAAPKLTHCGHCGHCGIVSEVGKKADHHKGCTYYEPAPLDGDQRE